LSCAQTYLRSALGILRAGVTSHLCKPLGEAVGECCVAIVNRFPGVGGLLAAACEFADVYVMAAVGIPEATGWRGGQCFRLGRTVPIRVLLPWSGSKLPTSSSQWQWIGAWQPLPRTISLQRCLVARRPRSVVWCAICVGAVSQ
jgi:hypothetical protein